MGTRLNQEVADMQNAGSLTGRKKAAALAKGLKAQETLNKYSQCNVFWQPIDAAPLTTGGNGYVDGGDVDISNFERDNYPAAPLTEATDGYSEPNSGLSSPHRRFLFRHKNRGHSSSHRRLLLGDQGRRRRPADRRLLLGTKDCASNRRKLRRRSSCETDPRIVHRGLGRSHRGGQGTWPRLLNAPFNLSSRH